MSPENAAPKHDTKEVLNPKVFLSYAWTSNDHVEWVLDLAKRLVNDEVDVVIDRWDLEPGQDKYHFMERMVNDPSITKVLVICDQQYARKANDRRGGVGTESTIISQEVYNQVAQTKFLPVITEKDADKNPYVPVFLKSRIHIDLSDPMRFEENYEELLRNIFGKPLHTKPPLGRRPAFLSEGAQPTRATTYKLKAFEDALMRHRPTATGQAADYLNALDDALQALRLPERSANESQDEPLAQTLLRSIEGALPLRNEFIDFVVFLNRYGLEQRLFDELQRFLARAVRLFRPEYVSHLPRTEHLGFLLGEMFLYTIAAMVKDGHFERAGFLLSSVYTPPGITDGQGRPTIYGYGVFDVHPETLERAHRAAMEATGSRHSRELTFMGELLHRRATAPLAHAEIGFDDLLGVDYALFVRNRLADNGSTWDRGWYGSVIPYARHSATLPLFAAGTSRLGFEKFKLLLGVESKAELEEKVEARLCGSNPPYNEVFWGDACQRHKRLMNLEFLDTV